MRDLGDIIEAVKMNAPVEFEELFYAVVAMSSLSTFDDMGMRTLVEGEEKQKKAFIHSPKFQRTELFNRWKKALNKSPKEWIGPDNDPRNADYQKRRTISLKILDKIMSDTKDKREE